MATRPWSSREGVQGDNLSDGSDEEGELALDEADIIHEVHLEDNDLVESLDDDESDHEMQDVPIDAEVWDDSIKVFKCHSDEVYTVACNPMDSNIVATGGADNRVFLWRIDEQWSFELKGHTDSVLSVAFSNDGQLLASGGYEGSVRIWESSTGHLKFVLEGPGKDLEIEWVKWHPRGHVVLAGSEDSSVWMWNGDKGTYLHCFTGHGKNVSCGDFTPDGKLVCTGSGDATLRIWNPKSGETLHVVQDYPYHTEGITCLAFSLDSTSVMTGSLDGSIHVVNIINGKVVNSLGRHSDSVECLAFSQGFPWAASGSLDQKLIIWDLQHSLVRCTCDHEPISFIPGHGGVTSLAWILNTKYVATGCQDGGVRIWDSLSSDCVKSFSGHHSSVTALSVSANGAFLVSTSADGTARVFAISQFS